MKVDNIPHITSQSKPKKLAEVRFQFGTVCTFSV